MSRGRVVLVLGVVAGVALLRLVAQAGGAEGSPGERFAGFLAEVRVAMAEREQELRAGLGLDGTHDVVDAGL